MPQHSRMVRGAVYCHSQVVTSSIVSSRFLTCFLTCCPVSIWMSPRLNLSTVYNLFIPLYCALIPYFSYPSSLVQHFPLYNAEEYVVMPENITKPSMLPAPSRIQYAPNFRGTHQHLFVCHFLCPADIQHPHFKCFQQFFTCFSQRPGLCCIQCYIPNHVLYKSLVLLTVQFPKLCHATAKANASLT